MSAVALTAGEVSASERAYRALVRRIATCELRPGEPFVERTEAARLGMSRTPVRDALNRLEQERLVRRVPKFATFVSLLDPDDITDNMALREAIEVEMARRVVRAGNAPVNELGDALDAQTVAMQQGDHRAFLDADERFHIGLVAAAGNARAVEAARRAWLHVSRVHHLEPMSVATMRRARREHAAITDALRDGASEAAERAIRRHLDQPLRRILREHARHHPADFAPETLVTLTGG